MTEKKLAIPGPNHKIFHNKKLQLTKIPDQDLNESTTKIMPEVVSSVPKWDDSGIFIYPYKNHKSPPKNRT